MRRRKRRRNIPKTIYHIRQHAIARASLRYGVHLNKEDYDALVAQIQNKQNVRFLFRESNKRTHWAVTYMDREMYAVYESIRHGIVTFLPQENLKHV